MSLLANATKAAPRMPIITITGDPGSGKTVLACDIAYNSASPAFIIQTEDGLSSVPQDRQPDTLGVVSTYEQVIEQLTALVKEEHQYQTLIIDSLTFLDELAVTKTMDDDPRKPRNIQASHGGYGAGFSYHSGLMGRIRKAAGVLNTQKNMCIIFIAHSTTTQVDLPDMADPYTRFDLNLSKKAAHHFSNDVDMVAYMRLQTFLRGDEKKKAVSNGQREVVVATSAAHIAKNRFGIQENVPVTMGENPFINLIPAFTK